MAAFFSIWCSSYSIKSRQEKHLTKTMDHVGHEMFHTSHRWLRSLHHTIWDCILWGLKIKEEGLWVNYWAKLNTDECLATHPVSTVQLVKERQENVNETYIPWSTRGSTEFQMTSLILTTYGPTARVTSDVPLVHKAPSKRYWLQRYIKGKKYTMITFPCWKMMS